MYEFNLRSCIKFRDALGGKALINIGNARISAESVKKGQRDTRARHDIIKKTETFRVNLRQRPSLQRSSCWRHRCATRRFRSGDPTTVYARAFLFGGSRNPMKKRDFTVREDYWAGDLRFG